MTRDVEHLLMCFLATCVSSRGRVFSIPLPTEKNLIDFFFLSFQFIEKLNRKYRDFPLLPGVINILR